jgi:DNA-binding NarL/FixJ family response regulator
MRAPETMAQGSQSVLIVEDHPLFSKGLASLIKTGTSYTIAGEARTGPDALQLLRSQKPALAIVDLNLGNEEGLELIRDLHAYAPELVVLVLSMYDEHYYAERALSAGARGYIMKDEASNKVIDAIHTVMSGKVYLSEAEKEHLLQTMAFDTVKESATWFADIKKLSNRQFQIFTLMGRGLGTADIAVKLNLSAKTVDTHKENIKLKLHCTTSLQLRQLAIEWTNRAPNKERI